LSHTENGAGLSPQNHKAVFLDRDGTIIKDLDYLGDPDKIEFLPGAIEALRSLHDRGFLLVVISNQSGVARGIFDEAACAAVNQRFVDTLASAGVPVAASRYCPHLPGAAVPEYDIECDCRKPAGGLFEKTASDLGISPGDSWAVGDSLRDLIPAKKLGTRTVLVFTGKGKEQKSHAHAQAVADFMADDLSAAARLIIRNA